MFCPSSPNSTEAVDPADFQDVAMSAMAYNSDTLSVVRRLEPVVSNHLSANQCSHRTGLEMPANLVIYLCSLPVVIKKLL